MVTRKEFFIKKKRFSRIKKSKEKILTNKKDFS